MLGMRIVGLPGDSLLWQNNLGHKDLPWLQDHELGNVAVFPAAGHLSLAIEAVRQVSQVQGLDVKGISFRDVAIDTALIVPEVEEGIEIQFRMSQMKRAHDTSVWFSFAIESVTDNIWTKHCEGNVCALLNDSKELPGTLPSPVDIADLQQRVPSRRWYKAFERVGFEYGPSFQKLGTVRTDGQNYEAAAEVEIVTESGVVQGESRYVLHPATVDSCLHLMIIAINKGLHKGMESGVVPVNIEQMSFWFPTGEENTTGSAVAWMDKPLSDEVSRHQNTHMKLHTAAGNLVLEIQGMRTVKYEAAVPQRTVVERSRAPYMRPTWRPDITAMGVSKVAPSSLAETIELLDHKQALNSIAFVGWSQSSLENLLPSVSKLTEVFICDASSETLETLQCAFGKSHRVTRCLMNGGSFTLTSDETKSLETQDAVVLNVDLLVRAEDIWTSIKTLLGDSGKLIVQAKQTNKNASEMVTSAGFSPAELQFDCLDMSICIHSAAPYMNGFVPTAETVTLLAMDKNCSTISDLVSSLTDKFRTVDVLQVEDFKDSNKKTIIYDDGKVLASLKEKTFNNLKKALLSKSSIVRVTSGVNEGKNVVGSMVQGFLRAIRSEQAAAKIMLLDADKDSSKDDISRAIISKLKYAATTDSGVDTEFWLHDGVLQINRVVPNKKLNRNFKRGNLPAEHKAMPRELALTTSPPT